MLGTTVQAHVDELFAIARGIGRSKCGYDLCGVNVCLADFVWNV